MNSVTKESMMNDKKGNNQIGHFAHGVPKKIRMYWRKLMDSTQKKMSTGARQVLSIITWARKDNWRRKNK